MKTTNRTIATTMLRKGVGVAALVVGLTSTGVALAQVPEPPELPLPEEVPEPLAPGAEAVAPTTNYVCRTVGSGPGTVTSALSLAGLAQAIVGSYLPVEAPTAEVPGEVYDYALLAQQPCTALPSPQRSSECTADREIDGVTDEVYGTGAGIVAVFIPVPTVSTGPAVDTAIAAEREASQAGAPIPGTPAADAADQLGCEDVLGQLPGGLTDDDDVGSVGATPAPAAPSAPSAPDAGAPASSVGAPLGQARAEADVPTSPVGGTELAAPTPQPTLSESTTDRWPRWRLASLAVVAIAAVGAVGWRWLRMTPG